MMISPSARILIIGGYGNAGQLIAKHLVNETTTKNSSLPESCEIVLAGRNLSRAQALANELNGGSTTTSKKNIEKQELMVSSSSSSPPLRPLPRVVVSALRVDVVTSTLENLKESFASCFSRHDDTTRMPKLNIVVVASSTTRYAAKVARAVMEVGTIDYYYDIQLSNPDKIRALKELVQEQQEAQMTKNTSKDTNQNYKTKSTCFVTDGGYHPGLPAAMVRYAASTRTWSRSISADDYQKDNDNTKTTAGASMISSPCLDEINADQQYYYSLEVADLYALIQMNWKSYDFSDETIDEFATELCDMQSMVYQQEDKSQLSHGQPSPSSLWQSQSFTTYREYEFVLGNATTSSTATNNNNHDSRTSPLKRLVKQKKVCVPLYMAELESLPKDIPSLRELGMYISGFDWFTDLIVLPIAMLVMAIFGRDNVTARRAMGRLLLWSLQREQQQQQRWWSSPLQEEGENTMMAATTEEYCAVVLEAIGTVMSPSSSSSPPTNHDDYLHHPKRRLRLEVSHENGYELTAVPVVATILQLFELHSGRDADDDNACSSSSSIATADNIATTDKIPNCNPDRLHFQGQLVEPIQFMKDLGRLGMHVSEIWWD